MWQVFCDFDGTITNRDSMVFLTERFGAGTGFRIDIVEAFKQGKLTITELIEQELATVRATWEQAEAALKANISVDPSFPEFVDWCQKQGHSLTVVSSGMMPVLDLFIGDMGIPRFAHSVDISPRGWRYHRRKENDKEVILEKAKKDGSLIYIGDGTSDVSAIRFAEILFAKSFLAEYCSDHEVDFVPYESFEDVRRVLSSVTRLDSAPQ
jgi:2,3-diketo-5-methylthio-1-phosphopentane phosphatase